MKKFILILIASIGISFYLSAQTAGDYRSVGSGNWNDPTKWEVYNGSSWIAASTYPGQNPGTGAVDIWANHEIKITESVPHPISSLYVVGLLSFSAQNAVSLVVLGQVIIFGELRIDDQEGAKKHSLSIGGNLGVGDRSWPYEYSIFQTINQDDELGVIFNTTNPDAAIWSSIVLSFQEVTFNGIGISLETTLHVSHVNFINGIVHSSGFPSINFLDGATYSGASTASFVDGMVMKSGDDPFTFPIGNGIVYAPLTISAPAGPASITATYIRSNASNYGPISDPALFNVSNCELWELNAAQNNLNVTVNWSAASGCGSSPYITNVSEVTLAHFDHTIGSWKRHGGSGIGSATNGSVTSNGVNSYGYFTLGNLGACNAPWGGTAANITSNSATLSWPAVNGAISYDVDYKLYNSSVWINAAAATTNASATLSGLSSSSTYDWRIKTNCSLSTSSYRNYQFITTCGVPSALSTSSITNNSAIISWLPVSNLSYYNVQYKQSAVATWTTVATSMTSLLLNGLSASTGYDCRVFTNCGGQENYAQTSFTTLACNDVYEANNTSSQAKTISVGNNIIAIISSTNDVDWFKVTTPNNSNTNLQVNLNNLPADYDLYVYNKTLKLVGSSVNSGTANEVVIYNSNARKATYYIKVVGKNGAYNTSQCYNLLAQVNSTAGSVSGKSYPANEVTDISDKQLLYPNPASEFVMLHFNSIEEGPVTVQIFNTAGQLVKQSAIKITKGYNHVKIAVNDVKQGMYLLRINKGDLNLTRKFVIAR